MYSSYGYFILQVQRQLDVDILISGHTHKVGSKHSDSVNVRNYLLHFFLFLVWGHWKRRQIFHKPWFSNWSLQCIGYVSGFCTYLMQSYIAIISTVFIMCTGPINQSSVWYWLGLFIALLFPFYLFINSFLSLQRCGTFISFNGHTRNQHGALCVSTTKRCQSAKNRVQEEVARAKLYVVCFILI